LGNNVKAKLSKTDAQKTYISVPGVRLPSDFTVAVGAANTYAYADLVLTKKSNFLHKQFSRLHARPLTLS
jgi:hypothetical protein